MSIRRNASAALAGVAAGGLTLGVAEVVSAVAAPSASPVLAVGSAFIDLTPPPLKNFAVENFGTNDKLVLLIGMGVVITVLAAVAGVLSLRNRWIGRILVGLLGAAALAAAVTRADATVLSVAPSLVGTAAGLVALDVLVTRLAPRADGDGAPRRSFLLATGVVAGLAAVTALGGRIIGSAARDVADARAALDLPAPSTPVAALPAGVQSPVPGVTPFTTPNADFYRIDTALTVPRIDPETWSLRIHGMVEEEIMITYTDLLEADLIETWLTLTCVSNEVGGNLVGNAKWLGLPVRELLARARPTADADMVLSRSDDGFSASTPIEALTDDDLDALLAIGMNDEPLPLEHGFPVRMVVPGLYGFVSATKWVTELEVTRFADQTAYWTDRGWSDRAPIKTACRLEVPGGFAQVPEGEVAFGGTAWAQTRGISAVEVSVDDSDWEQATLATDAGTDTWRQWSYTWTTTGTGLHTIRVRAVDGDGEVQTADLADPIPNGSSGYHTRQITVV